MCKIARIEREFEDSFENVVKYFNDPANDYMGYGFGAMEISEMLGINYLTLRKYCRARHIRLRIQKRFNPLDDICFAKYFMPFLSYAKMIRYPKRWIDLQREFGLSGRGSRGYYTNRAIL